MNFCHTRHCSECGKVMGRRHCKNRDCPESPLFRHRGLKAELIDGVWRAQRLRAEVDDAE